MYLRKLLDQYGYTAFCVITGLGIPLLINSYFSRRLIGLAVMPDKRSVLIETQALFGARQRVIPLQGMRMIHSTRTSFEGMN